MKKKDLLSIKIDDQGHLILPDEVMRQYGFYPGVVVRLEMLENGLALSHAVDSLRRVYVESTNTCNLGCRTCMRNVWDEPLGQMSPVTFAHILEGIKTFTPLPTIFFGGFGEPLSHPNILDMVSEAKETGAAVELITNGTLLDEAMSQRIIEIGLDRLWVSIDGATPESYTDVRLGDALPLVIANLKRLQELRFRNGLRLPKLGIAFVAMKRNIAGLAEVIRLGKSLGADQFSISNVLPHTRELQEEILYARSMYDSDLEPSPWPLQIALPQMDMDPPTLESLVGALKGRRGTMISGYALGPTANRCPFVEKGSISIRWDGAVSPCLALLHSHQSYLAENLRISHAYSTGNINECSLSDLWNDPDYTQLRKRLLQFDFSPCTFCNSCEMAEANLEDCYGNELPACGGCLWARGFIQCP